MTYILGISAFYHDSAASLIHNGDIIGAVQEERFTRIKHDPSFPSNAIKYVLSEANISMDEISYVVFYEKPFLKFERLIETYVKNSPMGFNSFRKSMPIWLREKLFQKNLIHKCLNEISNKFSSKKIYFSEHHLSHAASAFYPSPFKEAVILTIDSVGEWATTTIGIGKNENIEILEEINFPDSIGLLYSAFTYYLGFKVNSGEYKVMGLAPYGKPIYKKKILDNLISIKDDGSFILNQKYFNYMTGLTMTNEKFSKLFKNPVRKPEKEKLTQFHMDIASSIQAVIEYVVLNMIKFLSKKYNSKNLCMAGGVALNCVLNTKILEKGYFKNIWIQPAAGDAGGSLGAALLIWFNELKNNRIVNSNDSMKGSYLGPKYEDKIIQKTLEDCNANFKLLNENKLIENTAKYLAEGKAIGWFQGRMEFGPRALGSRSIIADPRLFEMQKNLNLKIKYRESFRPFAPSILLEDVEDWFELNFESQYMLFINRLKKNKIYENFSNEDKLFGFDKLKFKRSVIPAVTHIDYTSRFQTVNKINNPKFHSLISEFKKITGCPILVNTSFNVRGEPIVNSPKDAFNCFMGTELDVLIIENYFLIKNDQEINTVNNYKDNFKLD